VALTRRGFLAGLAASSATGACVGPAARPRAEASGAARIERIELTAVRYPMTGYFKFFSGARGAGGRAAVLVRMSCADGTVGWGQSVPIAKWSYETLETSFCAMRDYLAPALIGRDPLDIEGAQQAMDREIAPGFSTGMPISRAGLDLALHDLAGKLSGRSLAELFGREPGGKLTLSWTVNARTLDEVGALVAEGRARGYRHFNIKVAPDPDFDVALAREVRRLAPDGFLWADANGGYEPEQALAAAPRLAAVGVDVLEAPLRPNRIAGYRALRQQAALPILMDEAIVSPVELEEFDRLGMLDGVAMKPARCGGLWSNRRQIEYCERQGLLWLGSGLTDPDISLAATLGLYAAYGLRKPAALNGPQFLAADVLAVPLRIEGGEAWAPTGPGLGIEVDEDAVDDLFARHGHGRAVVG
jgi:L-alanine-DL-glutamate epimerase-like enolase superfamily enzyme